MGMNRIVIVGASLAGLRTAEALRREGFTGQLLFVGAEPHAPYDRPPLSKAFLAGRVDAAGIALRQSPRLEATWLLGRRAERLLASDRRIVLADGEEVSFDGLVIATGAAPRSLPGLRPLRGVTFLRTVDDGLRLRQMLQRRPRIAVLGTGFIGTEIASTCRQLGLEVTLLGALPVLHRPLGQLSSGAAERVRRHGVRVL